jgi:hypothetical protein
MLGHPSIQRYSLALVHALLLGVDVSSENPSGADNQQETAFAGSSETVRGAPWRTSRSSSQLGWRVRDEDTVRPSWRHEELGRNDLAAREPQSESGYEVFE